MPSGFYIYLPIACAVVALAASLLTLRQTESRGSDRVYIGVAFAFAASMYFALVFGLLAFVPGPGSAGPVQYASGSQGAMTLFKFRSQMISVALVGIPMVALLDLIALTEASRTKRPDLKGVAAVALLLLLFGLVTAFSSARSWMLGA
ncbi:MAG: hypothetical protein K8I27_12660 [Planctomycetes bacterium]|nr:hypothetical protein [Planctomycetota bacterium]